MIEDLNKVIKSYEKNQTILILALLGVSLTLSYMVCIVVPNITRSTIHDELQQELDSRHGVLLNQIQAMMDEEFTTNLYRIQ